jgi:uncharacterized protein with HEPN domain
VISERDEFHLDYVLDSIDLIARYTSGDKRRFEDETVIQDAVLRRLETLADAAAKLPATLKDRHPEIPWRAVQDFRNVAAHAYTEMDLEVVWQIVVNDLPTLREAVAEELRAARRGRPADR